MKIQTLLGKVRYQQDCIFLLSKAITHIHFKTVQNDRPGRSSVTQPWSYFSKSQEKSNAHCKAANFANEANMQLVSL